MTLPRETVHRCLACGEGGRRPEALTSVQMHPDRDEYPFVRCTACGLVYLGERVGEAALERYYGSPYLPHRGHRAWGRYGALFRLGQRRLDRARIRLVRRFAPLGPGTRILDVGCGRPTFLREASRRLGCRCTGVDLTDEGWRGEPAFDGLELIVGDPRELPRGRTFDVVTMWHYLEHDYDPVATLGHLRARAAPGAVLVVEVPNLDSWSRRVHGRHWAGFHTPRHTAVYSTATLAAVLERGGWTPVARGVPGTLDPYLLWWLSWRERRGTEWRESMERWFPEFVLGKLLLGPALLVRRISLDVQVAVAVAR